MLMGRSQHNIDAKGRISLPAKFREQFSGEFVISKGLADECLCLYTMDEWKVQEDKIKTLPQVKAKAIQRYIFSSASLANLDKQGRMVIPPELRQYASLDKEVVIIGAQTRLEIWDKEKLDKEFSEITPESIEEIMSEFGL